MTSEVRFTPTDKQVAVRRELGWRRKVFPNRVADGRMKADEAAYQIAIFEAIERDYAEQAQAAVRDLFGGAR